MLVRVVLSIVRGVFIGTFEQERASITVRKTATANNIIRLS